MNIRRLLLTCLTLMLPTVAVAQMAQERPAVVMVLGTYHFAAPGLDASRYAVADVLTPRKQREIEEVVDSLARFDPTKIAIEALPSVAERFDSSFAAYREGTHELGRDEREQIAFRLAKRLGHHRLYPVDHLGSFPFGKVMEHAGVHEPAFIAWFEKMIASNEAVEDSLQRTASIREILLHDNDPDRLADDHANYVRAAGVGAGAGFAGAEFLAAWYSRNIHIFANITRIAGPGDRILVLIGEGHVPILRHLVRSAPGYELVEPACFLE